MTIIKNNIQNISEYEIKQDSQYKNRIYKKAIPFKIATFILGAILLSGKAGLPEDIKSMTISNFINLHTIFNVTTDQLQIDENELGRRLVAFSLGARYELQSNFTSRGLFRRLPNFRDSDLKTALAYSSSSLFHMDASSQKFDMDGGESCSTVGRTTAHSRYTSKNTTIFSMDEEMQKIYKKVQESVPNYKIYDVLYLLGQLMTLNTNVNASNSTMRTGDIRNMLNLENRKGLCQILNYFLTLSNEQLQSFSNTLFMSNNEIFDQNPTTYPIAFSTKIKNSLGPIVKPGVSAVSGSSLKDLYTLSLMNFQGNSMQGTTSHSFASWKPNTGNVLSLQDAVDFAIYSHRVYGGQVSLQTYVNNILLQLIKNVGNTDLNNATAVNQQQVTFAANEQNRYSFNTANTTVNLDSIIPAPGLFQGWSISDVDYKTNYLNNHRTALACLESTKGMTKDKYDHLIHKPKGSADKTGGFEYYIDQLEQQINSFITSRNNHIAQNTPDFNSVPIILKGNNSFNYNIRENE